MTQQKFTFIKSLNVLFARIFSGRVHFPKEYAGKILLMGDGKKFQVLRDLKVDPKQSPEKPVAVFKGCRIAVNISELDLKI